MNGVTSPLLEGLARIEPGRRARQPGWLRELRRSAVQWVLERGLPSGKDEGWQHTHLGPLLELPFEPAARSTHGRVVQREVDRRAGDLGGARLVLVNGYVAPELSSLASLPRGMTVTGLDAALAGAESRLESLLGGPFRERPQAFTALSTALAEDVAWVQIPAEAQLERPLHVVCMAESSASPRMSHPRVVVLAGPRSRATVVVSHLGAAAGTHLTNAVTHVVLEEGAALDLYQLQDEPASAIHVALVQVRAGRGSRFTSHSLALGASSARHEVLVRLEAEGAEVCLNGLYFADGERRLDNLTTIEHVAPHCRSRERYQGIASGRGRGAFDGRIIVHPGAFKTDASQSNKNLLLSEAARVATHPRFEIFADDVKCAHGAVVGQLDESAVFYLRSRGVPQRVARDLLTYAFVSEMVGLLRVETLRDRVARTLASRLGGLEVTAWS